MYDVRTPLDTFQPIYWRGAFSGRSYETILIDVDDRRRFIRALNESGHAWGYEKGLERVGGPVFEDEYAGVI